jgi:RHS repeat-associated protein
MTLFDRDTLGRDTAVHTPVNDAQTIWAQQRIRYNVSGRVWQTQAYGPAMNHAPGAETWAPAPSPAETLLVTTVFDEEGLPLTVSRGSGTPGARQQVTTFTYDRAGRKRTEDLGGIGQSFTYDPSGNLTVWAKMLFEVRTEYDALGRVTKRTVPEARYGPECLPEGPSCFNFPLRPNAPSAYVVPAEVTDLRYDLMGRMVYAQNGDAVVQRSYYPDGLLKTDTTRLRTYAGAETSVYGTAYTYDVLGRVRTLEHPGTLAAANAQRDSFAYDAVTGALSSARDRHGLVFNFLQDAAGRPRSTHMPFGQMDSVAYDRESRAVLRVRGTASAPGALQNDTLQYDVRGKLVRVDVRTSPTNTYVNWYTGLGSLAGTEWDNVSGNGTQREQFRLDPLGNVMERRTPDAADDPYEDVHYLTALDTATGRVLGISKTRTHPKSYLTYPGDEVKRVYDGYGNMTLATHWASPAGGGQQVNVARSYYSADGRLRAVDTRDVSVSSTGEVSGSDGSWEEYRYDPLGRRIMVRTVRSGLCAGATKTARDCANTLTWYLWAGDQVLWELRAPGGDEDNLRATTGTGTLYGRVSYFHAGGIDRPLTITKEGVGTIITHQNWRGELASGTWGASLTGAAAGSGSDCHAGASPHTCAPVNWPGWRTSAWHRDGAGAGTPGDPHYWFGSLAGSRDGSGQMYMRNRYYDPATGQFTQTDPIGLAGGLNAYGFAAGDPVTYSDPYGLAAESDTTKSGKAQEQRHDRCEVATILNNYISALSSRPWQFRSGSFPAEFDFKFAEGAENARYQVGDRWLRADEFGNFSAGYAAQHSFNGIGHMAVRAAGISYAMERKSNGERTSGEHWSDRESVPMINAGAARATLEQANNGGMSYTRDYGERRRPYVAPLTSRRGCN